MPELDPLALAVLSVVALVFVLAVLLPSFRRRRRAGRLETLADAVGWQFRGERDFRHRDSYRAMRWFRDRHGLARNTLWGTFEIGDARLPAKAGDYVSVQPAAHDQDGRHVHVPFSYLIVHLPWPNLPDFSLEPTGRAPVPGQPLGDGELAFEQGSFAHAFAVDCARADFMARFLDDRTRETLLAARGPTIDLVAARLCIADGRRLWTPEQFVAAMHLAGAVCERLSRVRGA